MGLREAIDLALHELEFKQAPRERTGKGREIQSSCPFHSSQHHRSFGINIDTGFWNCFAGCGAGWIDSLLINLGFSKDRVKHLLHGVEKPHRSPSDLVQWKSKKVEDAPSTLPEEILSIFHWCPTSMLNAGWEECTLLEFNIGFDQDEERITFPIRDSNGQLVAVSGRTVYDNIEPRYRVYREKHLYGYAPPGYSPPYERMVYNIHRAMQAPKGSLITISEGFKEVMKLHLAGITGVALIGAAFGKGKLAVLNRLYFRTKCTFVILLDNDTGGIQQAENLGDALSQFADTYISFTETKKDVSDEPDLNEVRRIVQKAEPFPQWKLTQNKESQHGLFQSKFRPTVR